ncbi:MAG: hypothetical protein ABR964_16315 [Tepidisphaeraceae bacterium]
MHHIVDHRHVLDHSPLRRRRHWHLWLLGFVVLLVAMILASALLPERGAPGMANMIKCAGNLSQIGKAIGLYAADHRNQFPDSFQTLMVCQQLDSAVFVCPASSDTPAAGATTRATAQQLSAGGHCSYIYLGCGLTVNSATANTVVAYEPLGHHPHVGINVLFGDGQVEVVTPQAANKIVGAAAAGRLPATMP